MRALESLEFWQGPIVLARRFDMFAPVQRTLDSKNNYQPAEGTSPTLSRSSGRFAWEIHGANFTVHRNIHVGLRASSSKSGLLFPMVFLGHCAASRIHAETCVGEVCAVTDVTARKDTNKVEPVHMPVAMIGAKESVTDAMGLV